MIQMLVVSGDDVMPAIMEEPKDPVYADLLSVMTPEDGWNVDVAVLASYSLDFTALGLMLMSMAGVWEQDGKRPSKTDFARALWENPKRAEQVLKTYPLARLGEPDDIAGAAVFLASRAGAWMKAMGWLKR